MNYMVASAITVTLIFNVFFQLAAVAQDSSDSVLTFADQMNQQLECTLNDISLSDCELTTEQVTVQDLESHMNETQKIADELIKTAQQNQELDFSSFD